MVDRIGTATAELVAAYVSNNRLPASELPGLIAEVHAALARIAPPEPEVARPSPAAIRRSITPEALVSFEDGKGYKSLRRHLTVHGLTPEGYRTKWGLPADYPMVAPEYSARRSAIARGLGLGDYRRKAADAA